MPYKNAYYKMLPGLNIQTIVAKAVAYTTQASYKLFQANAVEGEIGFYKTSDNSLLDGLTAAGAAVEIFVALKRDGNVERTVPFKVGNVNASRTAYVAPVKQVTTVTLPADASLTVGYTYEIAITDLSAPGQPYPTWVYQYTAVTGDTYDTLGAKLVTLITDTTSATNRDRDLCVTAAYNSTTNALTLTALNFGVAFRVAVRQKLTVATVTYTTAMKTGSGFPAQVKLFQDAGDIYKGFTTNYPLQGTLPENFGKPTDFVDPAGTYNLYNLSGYADDASKTNRHVEHFKRDIVLAIPASGGPETAVKTILGL